jgi:hypothetical protein
MLWVIVVAALAGEAHSRVIETEASKTRASFALWIAINIFTVVTSVTFFIGTSFLRRAPHPDVSSEANRINVFLMLTVRIRLREWMR